MTKTCEATGLCTCPQGSQVADSPAWGRWVNTGKPVYKQKKAVDNAIYTAQYKECLPGTAVWAGPQCTPALHLSPGYGPLPASTAQAGPQERRVLGHSRVTSQVLGGTKYGRSKRDYKSMRAQGLNLPGTQQAFLFSRSGHGCMVACTCISVPFFQKLIDYPGVEPPCRPPGSRLMLHNSGTIGTLGQTPESQLNWTVNHLVVLWLLFKIIDLWYSYPWGFYYSVLSSFI